MERETRMKKAHRISALALAGAWVFSGAAVHAIAEDQTSLMQGAATGSQGAAPGSTRGLMNPDISLDGLFSAAQFNRADPVTFDAGHDPRRNGINIQQVELTLAASVDPYFRGDANLLFTPEGGIEIEEAYATTLDLPWNLQFKGGSFFTAFGRNNPSHPHAWDFVNKPLVLGRFFGGDGLRAPGAQLSWLSPLPWYSELIASVQNSTGETAASFNRDGTMRTLADGIWLVRWNNFVSITDAWMLNAGASYVNGRNAQDQNTRTQIVGGDLLLRYREPESLSFVALQIEALRRFYGVPDGSLNDWGWYAQLNYRLPASWSRWHVGLRYDFVGPKQAPVITATENNRDGENPIDTDYALRYRVSPVVTFYPSEFSKIRFQYDYDHPQNLDSPQQAVFVQLEFLMGAHGAHKF